MTWRRTLLYFLLSLLVIVGGGLFFLLSVYEDVPIEPGWELAGATDVPAGAVTVRFTGTSTLLFSDGETEWMIDGWFSRPGPLQLLLSKIGPDIEAIEHGLAANEVSQLAAVIPVHSHFDHAMDAPEVAKRTGPVAGL